MAHGVLHRSNGCVHAHRPVPCVLVCLPGPPRQQSAGLSGHRMGSSPRLLQLLTGTQHLARTALRGSAMCVAAVPLWMRLLPTRLADLCFCTAQPLGAVKPFVSRWPASFAQPGQGQRLLVSPAAGTRASLHPCTPCCTPCRTHSAACHSLPGTQGPRPTRRPDSAVRRRAAVHTALCTAQAALNSTSIPSGTKTVSAAMACQDSPR